ncbi:MAG: hypothetical protein QF672_01035, partial [SAR202 cluster bacterium]|nr:hypothetical protein [SAR202 cluster bacterium]
MQQALSSADRGPRAYDLTIGAQRPRGKAWHMLLVLSEAAERRLAELARDTARDHGSPVDSLTTQVHTDEEL